MMLIDNFRPFHHHTHRPKMNFIIVCHHVVQGMILFVLHPFSLAGGLRDLVGGEAGLLSVGPIVDQVREVGRLVEGDGVVEIPSVHHGGVNGRSIGAGPQPGQALLEGDSLWDGEGPVDGIQLGVSIDATIVNNVCPGERTRGSSNVPFSLLL